MAVALPIDGAIEKLGFGLTQLIYISAASGIFFVELLSLVSDGILLPVIKCEWQLTSAQATGYLLSTKLAYGIGGFLGGKLGDKLGRRISILYGLAFQITTTTIALNCYSIPLYTLFHALNKVSFGVVMPCTQTIAMETCPGNKRFLIKVSFGLAASLGATCGAFLGAYNAVYGWRTVQLFVTLPCYLVFCVFYFLSPSPRFLLVKGRQSEAERVVEQFSRWNSKPISQVALKKESQIMETPGSYKDMFGPTVARQTYKVMYMLVIKGMFESSIHMAMPYLVGNASGVEAQDTDSSSCYTVSNRSYSKMMAAFIPCFFLHPSFMVTAQTMGRRFAISSAWFTSSFFFFVSLITPPASFPFSLTLGAALATTAAARGLIILYVAELYPTTLRGVSSGLIWATDCAGSLLSPFFVEYFIVLHPRVFIFVTAVMVGSCFVVSRTFRAETLNKPMVQSLADLQERECKILTA